MAVGLRRDRDEISFRGPRLEVVCHLGSSMTGERAVVSDHIDTSIAYGEETLVEGGVIGQRHATTSEAEEYTEAGTAFCDVHLSDLTDGLAELARLAKEWDDYTAGADTGLLTDDELWDLWGLVYTDLVREDWGVRDALASIDRVCLFDDQEAWEQEAQALRAASHELNSGFRPLCPVLFASIMENSVYGNSVDACETLHSTWPYPLVDT